MLVFQLSKVGHVVSCNRMIQLPGLNHVFVGSRRSAPKTRRIAGRGPRSRISIRALGYYSAHLCQRRDKNSSIFAGFVVRGFQALVGGSTSIRPATMLTLHLALTENKYPEDRQVATFYREVLERVASLPGVGSAVAVAALPYSGTGPTCR